jgi:putative acetyltransferase
MKANDPAILVVDASDGTKLGLVRDLFRSYATEWSATIAETLRYQGFEDEVAGLPGRYAPPAGCLLLAMGGKVSAGCVAMRDLGGGTCEMKRLYVSPDHRGRGVARVLVEEVVRRAERAGYLRMVLDTMPEMAQAIALYQKHGFVETDPYWDDPTKRAVFMERPLATFLPSVDQLDNKAR